MDSFEILGGVSLSPGDDIKTLFECIALAETEEQKKMLKYLIDTELYIAVHDKAEIYKQIKDKVDKAEMKQNIVPIGGKNE